MPEILLSTYNGVDFVGQQIESILGQTNHGWQLIARDDGSADRTVEILRQYATYVPLAASGLPAVAIAVAVLFPIGVWAAGVCGRRFGAHDHGRIVVDEVVGQLIALASFPAQPGWLLAGFLLFRVCDIWKPFPARRIDLQWRTPFGVMADDVVAGVYTNLALQAARLMLGT